MSLYLILNLASISIPFFCSFDKRMPFFKYWKYLFPAILISGIIFISWDVYFTKIGVWGFNPAYHSNLIIFGLPLEEWLFFFCIPYACVFTHYSLIYFFPDKLYTKKSINIISYSLIIIFFLLGILNTDKLYTSSTFVLTAVILIYSVIYHQKTLGYFYWTFLVMLIPFFIVNGILTGFAIPEEVVWYNNNENLGIRMITIPVEDTFYGFSLILLNILIIDFLKEKRLSNLIGGKP
ncbi:lycopene cyclase domain-containing protein [Flexithrix dorotheae]|uniref:lycopene cyclase domain-containing protein n=1 Tax=Flexithrix dorotheae TaxID=70993 RepID=UPI000368B86C|nr:lycopene cyclase domain-containing protein [Flexithrix dorotheae]